MLRETPLEYVDDQSTGVSLYPYPCPAHVEVPPVSDHWLTSPPYAPLQVSVWCSDKKFSHLCGKNVFCGESMLQQNIVYPDRYQQAISDDFHPSQPLQYNRFRGKYIDGDLDIADMTEKNVNTPEMIEQRGDNWLSHGQSNIIIHKNSEVLTGALFAQYDKSFEELQEFMNMCEIATSSMREHHSLFLQTYNSKYSHSNSNNNTNNNNNSISQPSSATHSRRSSWTGSTTGIVQSGIEGLPPPIINHNNIHNIHSIYQPPLTELDEYEEDLESLSQSIDDDEETSILQQLNLSTHSPVLSTTSSKSIALVLPKHTLPAPPQGKMYTSAGSLTLSHHPLVPSNLACMSAVVLDSLERVLVTLNRAAITSILHSSIYIDPKVILGGSTINGVQDPLNNTDKTNSTIKQSYLVKTPSTKIMYIGEKPASIMQLPSYLRGTQDYPLHPLFSYTPISIALCNEFYTSTDNSLEPCIVMIKSLSACGSILSHSIVLTTLSSINNTTNMIQINELLYTLPKGLYIVQKYIPHTSVYKAYVLHTKTHLVESMEGLDVQLNTHTNMITCRGDVTSRMVYYNIHTNMLTPYTGDVCCLLDIALLVLEKQQNQINDNNSNIDSMVLHEYILHYNGTHTNIQDRTQIITLAQNMPQYDLNRFYLLLLQSPVIQYMLPCVLTEDNTTDSSIMKLLLGDFIDSYGSYIDYVDPMLDIVTAESDQYSEVPLHACSLSNLHERFRARHTVEMESMTESIRIPLIVSLPVLRSMNAVTSAGYMEYITSYQGSVEKHTSIHSDIFFTAPARLIVAAELHACKVTKITMAKALRSTVYNTQLSIRMTHTLDNVLRILKQQVQLNLFGVDAIFHENDIYLTDQNYFPAYTMDHLPAQLATMQLSLFTSHWTSKATYKICKSVCTKLKAFDEKTVIGHTPRTSTTQDIDVDKLDEAQVEEELNQLLTVHTDTQTLDSTLVHAALGQKTPNDGMVSASDDPFLRKGTVHTHVHSVVIIVHKNCYNNRPRDIEGLAAVSKMSSLAHNKSVRQRFTSNTTVPAVKLINPLSYYSRSHPDDVQDAQEELQHARKVFSMLCYRAACLGKSKNCEFRFPKFVLCSTHPYHATPASLRGKATQIQASLPPYIWICGYGSLLSIGSTRITCSNLSEFQPVQCTGYERSFKLISLSIIKSRNLEAVAREQIAQKIKEYTEKNELVPENHMFQWKSSMSENIEVLENGSIYPYISEYNNNLPSNKHKNIEYSSATNPFDPTYNVIENTPKVGPLCARGEPWWSNDWDARNVASVTVDKITDEDTCNFDTYCYSEFGNSECSRAWKTRRGECEAYSVELGGSQEVQLKEEACPFIEKGSSTFVIDCSMEYIVPNTYAYEPYKRSGMVIHVISQDGVQRDMVEIDQLPCYVFEELLQRRVEQSILTCDSQNNCKQMMSHLIGDYITEGCYFRRTPVINQTSPTTLKKSASSNDQHADRPSTPRLRPLYDYLKPATPGKYPTTGHICNHNNPESCEYCTPSQLEVPTLSPQQLRQWYKPLNDNSPEACEEEHCEDEHSPTFFLPYGCQLLQARTVHLQVQDLVIRSDNTYSIKCKLNYATKNYLCHPTPVLSSAFRIPKQDFLGYITREQRYDFDLVKCVGINADLQKQTQTTPLQPDDQHFRLPPVLPPTAVTGKVITAVVCKSTTDTQYRRKIAHELHYFQEISNYYTGKLWGQQGQRPGKRYLQFCLRSAYELCGVWGYLCFAHSTTLDDGTSLVEYIAERWHMYGLDAVKNMYFKTLK